MEHFFKNNGIYFITFRLADSLPQTKIIKLREEYESRIGKIKETDINIRQELIDQIAINVYGKNEAILDSKKYGSCILKDEKVAEILYDKILSYHKSIYSLKCFSIMPNHVHVLLGSLGNNPDNVKDDVSKWINLIKGGSSRLINQHLQASGRIWAVGFWDRYIRNEFHYSNSFYYTVNNSEKAGLEDKYKFKPYLWRKDRDED